MSTSMPLIEILFSVLCQSSQVKLYCFHCSSLISVKKELLLLPLHTPIRALTKLTIFYYFVIWKSITYTLYELLNHFIPAFDVQRISHLKN